MNYFKKLNKSMKEDDEMDEVYIEHECETNLKVLKIPSFIKSFCYNGNSTLECIPKTVEKLELHENFKRNLFSIPSTIKYLKIGINTQMEGLEKIIDLEVLHLCNGFEKEINQYPPNLKILILQDRQNNIIQILNNLPNTIETIIFYNTSYTLEQLNNNEIDNLPINLNKIFFIEAHEYRHNQYFDDETIEVYTNKFKIPFGCELIFSKHIEINYCNYENFIYMLNNNYII